MGQVGLAQTRRVPRPVAGIGVTDRSKSARTEIESDTVLRFRPSERMLHWAIAIPFLVCFVTAAILILVYNPNPGRPYRDVVSWIHRISGACLFLFPALTFAIHRRDFRAHLENIREGWVWTWNDIRWLALMGLAAISKRFELPEQGKFNAAEKLNFMSVMTTYPLYIVTGVMIWLPGVAFAAWVVHVSMAALATPLVLGHIFMATINPDTRVGLQGMLTGFVDRQWAKHHYRRWYREQFERPVPSPAPVAVGRREPARETATPVEIRCPSCGQVQAVRSWAAFARSVFQDDPLACPGCATEMQALAVLATPADLEAILQRLDTRGAPGAFAKTLPPTPEPVVAESREDRFSRWENAAALPLSSIGTSRA
jgi:formate dehydrogenase subunit gamma